MKRTNTYQIIIKSLFIASVFSTIYSCKKLIMVPPPVNSITTTETFSDSTDATAAVQGIYSNMINAGGLQFSNGALTLYPGMSADEITPFPVFPDQNQFYANQTQANSSIPYGLWSQAYGLIYQANSCITGLESSKTLPLNVKNQLLGETKTLRAFFHFYLTNLYGDIPYITTDNFQVNKLAKRIPREQIYQAVIADLISAQGVLRNDYTISNGERTRINKEVATALLARVYLYDKDWKNAIVQSASLINNQNLYNLEPDLNTVFLKSSREAIFQLSLNTSRRPYNATPEGFNFVPSFGSVIYYSINPALSASFEPNDKRFKNWIDTAAYNGMVYQYPFKYKIGPDQYVPNATASEYYMVFRLAEQYLIRAEASAQNGDFSTATSDINMLRNRAGIPQLSLFQGQHEALSAIAHERQTELFCEWGHRWMDLKRTGAIDSVMSKQTPLKYGGKTWNSFQQLYPIPKSEIATDVNLTQNPGYNQ